MKIQINLQKLLSINNPRLISPKFILSGQSIWGTPPIYPYMIKNCLSDGKLMSHYKWTRIKYPTRFSHAERISYLVAKGWKQPISLHCGREFSVSVEKGMINEVDNWLIDDGNHRVAAAEFLGIEILEAKITKTSLKYLEPLGLII